MRPASRAAPRRALADIHVHQVAAARLRLEVGREGHHRTRARKRRIRIGTLHFSHWVPFENNHLGFFTIFDGDFEKYIQDFADKTSFVFDAVFPHVDGAPPTPVAKNAQAFYEWALEATTIRPSGSTAPTRVSRSKTSEPCWPTQPVARPATSVRVTGYDSSGPSPTARSKAAGALTDETADRRRRGRPRSTSRTSRGSFFAATRCRWCGTSC